MQPYTLYQLGTTDLGLTEASPLKNSLLYHTIVPGFEMVSNPRIFGDPLFQILPIDTLWESLFDLNSLPTNPLT